MKTAISLPEELFAEAERLAARLGTSRSELYRRAVAEFLVRHSPGEITEALDRAVSEIAERSSDLSDAAARHLLAKSEW